MSPAKAAEVIMMPCEILICVGPKNHVLDGSPDPTVQGGNFEGGKWRPIVTHRDSAMSCGKKWLKGSRCSLGCWVGWVQGSMY